MIFAALSSVLSVCENIIAMAVDITGWERKKASAVCGVLVFLLSLTTALGYSVIRFHPFGGESSWLELWDFIVSGNVQPLGSLALSIFCCAGFGWGWDAFFKEANTGKGLKVKRWMKPLFTFVVPASIIIVYVCGILPFILK
jgi:NSS family neurotransmitter:Na+ symporter